MNCQAQIATAPILVNTIDGKCPLIDNRRMKRNGEWKKKNAEVRALVNSWIARKGQGAILHIIEATGISRGYLFEFRDGKDIGWHYLLSIEQYITTGPQPELNAGFVAREVHEPLRTPPPRPEEILAQRLRSLADILESHEFSQETKKAETNAANSALQDYAQRKNEIEKPPPINAKQNSESNR